jgi:DNA-binding CsgD family transcriptional regulator
LDAAVKFLPLIIYILCFTSGFANLSLIVLAWIKTRNSFHTVHASMLLALAVYIIFFDVLQATHVISGGRFDWPGNLFMTLYLGSRIPVFLLIIPFLSMLFGFGFRARSAKGFFIRISFAVYVALALLSLIFILVSWRIKAWNHMPLFRPFMRISDLGMVSAGVLTIVSAMLFNPDKSTVSGKTRWLIVILILALLPYWFIQIFYRELGISLKSTFNSENILFFLWNLGSVFWYIRHLTGNESAGQTESPGRIGDDPLMDLSGREQEIALLAGHGKSNKEIAQTLGISPATVKNHLYNIYPKIKTPSRFALIDLIRRSHPPE